MDWKKCEYLEYVSPGCTVRSSRGVEYNDYWTDVPVCSKNGEDCKRCEVEEDEV
jgi:hypothetical protein